MSEKDDNEIRPYTGIWSYRHWLKVLPLGVLFGIMGYFKMTGRWPF